MKLKPKAARRLLLLAVVGALLVAAVVSLVVVRSWQKDRRTRQLRTDGMAAYKQADYPVALDNLGGYLRRKSDDREAWLAFAESRQKLEEAGGKHLFQAVGAYERACALDETDTASAFKLLCLYNQIGHFVEAKDLARRLRPSEISSADASKLEILLEEAAAMVSLKMFDPTLDALTERIVTLDPNNYRGTTLRSNYLIGADRKNDAIDFAKSLEAAHPNDPRFELLRQIVSLQTGQATDAKQVVAIFCKAAGLHPDTARRVADPQYTEPAFAGQLVAGFDSADMQLHSLMVLQDASIRIKDPDARRLFARREWQSGLAGAFLTDFPNPDMGPNGDPSDVLAFRALSLRDLGRLEEAVAVLTALRARPREYSAVAWSKTLSALLEKTDAKESLSLLDAAIQEDPTEPVFVYFRGDILMRLGRPDEAREAWNNVYKSNVASGWAIPGIRIAETLLDEGRVDEAAVAANAASRRSTFSPSANLVLIRAEVARVESGRPVPDPADLLRRLGDTEIRLKRLDNAELLLQARRLILPARVSLLATLDRKAEARSEAEKATAEPGFLDADVTRRLTAVSVRTGLGFETKVLAASGNTDAKNGTLLSRALLLESQAQRDAAIQLLDDALAAGTEAQKAELTVIRAQFYDLVGHPDALKLWKSAAQTYPKLLAVQVAAIRGAATSADRAFVDQLIARITELGGSDPDRPSTDVRLGRARALLYKSPDVLARDEAVSTLRVLVLEAPGRLDLREALINALLLEDIAANIRPDYPAAIEQLTAASTLAPNRAPYMFLLVEVLRKQGRIGDAAAELGKLSLDATVGRASRIQAADRLAELRELEPALRAIESLIGESPAADVDVELLSRKAALLSSLRRDREAAETYRVLLRQPLTDPGRILAMANALRSLDDTANAQAALAKLDDPAIKPHERALARAAFAAAAPDPKAALIEYTRATELAPTDPRTWSSLARFHLGRSEFEAAQAAVRSGLEKVPNDPDLSVELQQILIAGKTESAADLAPLADALAKNPATARRAEAIRAIALAQKEGKLDDAAALTRVADEFADDPTTQLFVARRLIAGNPPHVADAARIMRRAATRYPSDTAIQEQATLTLVAANEWESALAAATAWRALSRNSNADLAVAESHLALGHARQALEAVRDYRLPAVIPDDDSVSLGVLNTRVRANIVLRDTAGAFQLLQPYLAQSSPARTRIALPAAAALVPEPADVRKWIEAAAAKMNSQSVDDQLAIAQTWSAAGDRLRPSRADFIKRALAAIDLINSSDVTGRVFEARAYLLDASGDHAGAITAGRAAIAKDPKSISGLLGLSRLLLAADGDPSEAVSLAQRAAAENVTLTEPLFVLANAQLRQADVRGASGDKQGQATARREATETINKLAKLAPGDFRTLFEIAILAEQAGDLALAISCYERVLVAPQGQSGRDLAAAKNNLAFALFTQSAGSPTSDSLKRAKTLADEAIQLAELSSFYETLGSIDNALGDRLGAINAYRKALALDARELPASVGLADLLAAGTAEEQIEAAAQIKQVDAAITAGGTLSDTRKQQLERARQKLAAR